MTLTLDDVRNKIIHAKPQLLEDLVLDVRLKAVLHKMGVITARLNNEMEPLCLTPWKRVDLLLNDIMTGPVWRFLHFCSVMHEEGKPQVLEALDVDIVNIKNQLDLAVAADGCPPPHKKLKTDSESKSSTQSKKCHYFKRSENDEMIQISNDLLPSLLQHCGSYNKKLMRTSLFGYQRNKPIDLTRIYIHHDASCKQNLREKIPVGKKELFLRLFGTRCPNCLSMEGPAGTGKSSYLEEYAYDWSQNMTSCQEKGPDTPCEGHMWELVVYIAAGGIRGSAFDAIRDNLRCHPYPKDQLMHAVEKDGEGILIMYDAMDELRHKDSIESISSYIEISLNTPRTPKVLAAARDGLLSIEPMYFDRQLHLEGFSLPQGIKYVKQYLKEMHSLSNHPVLQYVEAHPKDLEWVLTNPLRVHILSELIACGLLTLDDLKTLTTVKLFRSLDKLLLQRDKECRPTLSIQSTAFYQSCLSCLFTDNRIFSEEDIGKGSPYLSLLQRHEYMDQDFNDCCNYSFPHEMLFEYFSMRGLIECLMRDVEYEHGMLLWLCSNAKMRNVLQLTCGYIAQYEPQLLPNVVFIIRACLILQTEHVWRDKNELTQELLQLPAVLQETFPPTILTHGLTTDQAAKLNGISNKIQVLFTEEANNLKEAGWFLNGYQKDKCPMNKDMSPFHQFLLGCLQQLTPQQLEDVFSQTFNQIIPCTMYDGEASKECNSGIRVVPVNSVRWAAVEERSCRSGLELHIRLWSPRDLAPVLNTWSNLPKTQELLQQHKLLQQQVRYMLYIDGLAHHPCTSLPAEPWSQEQWTLGLKELLSPRYHAGEINVALPDSTPRPTISGLLKACSECITSGHGLTAGLVIGFGQVREEELIEFCTWAGEVGLKLELLYLRAVVSAGRGEKDVKDVDSDIRRRVEVDVGGATGQLMCTTYVTADGKVWKKHYHPDSYEWK